jgi:hypothetical protein
MKEWLQPKSNPGQAEEYIRKLDRMHLLRNEPHSL